MRSCGTPWSIRTSTALMAEPPVAEKRVCKRVISSRRRSEPKAPAAPDELFSLRSDSRRDQTHQAWGQGASSTGSGCRPGAWRRRAWPGPSPRRAGSRSCLSGRHCGWVLVSCLAQGKKRRHQQPALPTSSSFRGVEGQTDRQHSRRPASMASPARMIETPQIRPSKLTPL